MRSARQQFRHQLWDTGTRPLPLSLRMYTNLALSIYIDLQCAVNTSTPHVYPHMLLCPVQFSSLLCLCTHFCDYCLILWTCTSRPSWIKISATPLRGSIVFSWVCLSEASLTFRIWVDCYTVIMNTCIYDSFDRAVCFVCVRTIFCGRRSSGSWSGWTKDATLLSAWWYCQYSKSYGKHRWRYVKTCTCTCICTCSCTCICTCTCTCTSSTCTCTCTCT